MGERYAGEEDFCATSTALVARANVCTLWAARDHHRILAELRRCSHPTTRAPWVSDRIETGGGGARCIGREGVQRSPGFKSIRVFAGLSA